MLYNVSNVLLYRIFIYSQQISMECTHIKPNYSISNIIMLIWNYHGIIFFVICANFIYNSEDKTNTEFVHHLHSHHHAYTVSYQIYFLDYMDFHHHGESQSAYLVLI